jgi:predicted RNA-binding protein
MCESSAYLKNDSESEELLLEDVVMLVPDQPEPGKVTLTSILGDKKVVEGVIDHIDLMKHRIVLRSGS